MSGNVEDTTLSTNGVLVNFAPPHPIASRPEIRWTDHRPVSTPFLTGTVAVFPEGIPYSAHSNAGLFSGLVLGIEKQKLSAAATALGALQATLCPPYGVTDAFLVQALCAMNNDIRSGHPVGAIYGETIGAAVIAHLIANHSTYRPVVRLQGAFGTREPELVRDFILERLHDSLMLADIAQFMQIDVYALSRRFRQSFEIAPYRYVLRERIARVKQLLKMTDQSVTDIAIVCGLYSPSHLSAAFRVAVGVSPRVYRDGVRR